MNTHPTCGSVARLLLALPLLAAPVAGQRERPAASVATVVGRVQNVASGQYLNNARVTVKGTELVAFTDESGTYRLVGVPAGSVVLEVFYTGLDRRELSLQVASGATLEQNFDLTNTARYGAAAEAVQLDPFTVAAGRLVEGEALATNEQRFAPNLKNVVATDALGEIVGDGVGEFLKYLPGLTAEYSGPEIVGISARGFGSNVTGVYVDGAPVVSANANGTTASRTVDLLGLALNNASRVEVTKVPTPAMPADSLGGSVNLVGKSAFERQQAQLRWGVNLTGNNVGLALRHTPSPDDRATRKIQPGGDFDLTLPLGRTFGLVLTGMYTDKWNPTGFANNTFNTGGTATGASVPRPFRQSLGLQEIPRTQTRRSGSFRFDWRLTTNSVLSAGVIRNASLIQNRNMTWTANVGTNGTPTPATQPGAVALSYGDDYTIGATGRGAVTMTLTNQDISQGNTTGNLRWRFDDGRWRIAAGLSCTESRRDIESFLKGGNPRSLSLAMRNPVRVTFQGYAPERPRWMQVFDNANREVDIYDSNNYQITSAGTNDVFHRTAFTTGDLDVERRLQRLSFPLALQAGGRWTLQTWDKKAANRTHTYNGPDGNPATADSIASYLLKDYEWDSGFGLRNIPVVSLPRVFAEWRQNPAMLAMTPAQVVADETARISGSEYVREGVAAQYLQAEARFFAGRLRLLAGVRHEATQVRGLGPLYDPNAVYQRDATGSFVRDAAGRRIRKPEAGAAGSLEEVRLTRRARGAAARGEYDGYFPSAHATYALRENLLLRAAYAETYGRPDFTEIIPNTTINQADLTGDDLVNPDALKGTITVRNPSLRPWTARNYDLSLEHYSAQGGTVNAGLFWKEIDDFFGDEVRLATAADLRGLNLDSQYLGWRVSSRFNSGRARVQGAEVGFRQPLDGFARWGRSWAVFANATKLRLSGAREADFSGFIENTANWGFTYNGPRLSFMAKWNYRGLGRGDARPDLGPDGYQYTVPITRLDLNLGLQLTRRLRATATVGNALDAPQEQLRYGSATPAYARYYSSRKSGVALVLGLRGTF